VEKTIGLLLIIGLGFLLKSKIKSVDQLKGLKVIILSVALPATIFAALLSVHLDKEIAYLPFIGLLINLILMGVFFVFFKFSGLLEPKARTSLLLMPSLAPGLSCFPFISEYLQDQGLAMAAMADVGNKVFVLLLLYLLAMRWHYQIHHHARKSGKGRIKELLITLLQEPINIVIVVAILMLAFELNIASLPEVVASTILRMGAIMAPLVLLFIGMSVRIERDEIALILRLLCVRSGVAFLLSTLLIALIPGITVTMTLLLLAFSQSSVSFWPYAHISLVEGMEKEYKSKTFDGRMALSILAMSLPFSTVIILSIFSFPAFSISLAYPLVAGIMLLGIGMIKPIFSWLKTLRSGPVKSGSLEEIMDRA